MRGGSVFLTVIFSLMIESANPQSTRGVLNPLHEDAAAARAGKKIYEKRCQECHGGDARGGRSPALATGSFQVRADDRYLFDAIENGIPGTAMPPFETRNDTNIWQVVTYLRSLAGTVSEEVVSGDVIAGEEVFRGKGGCLSCHQVHGEGGRIGPDLSRIGKWVAQAIREVIVDPSGVQGRKPNLVVARTKNGRTIRGIRKNEDTLSIQLMDVTERFHFLRKKDLAALRYEDRSLMPDNYGQVLSKEELDNLVAYLKTLERSRFEEGGGDPSGGRPFLRTHPPLPPRTPELAHLLGRLSGTALFRLESDQHRECPQAADTLGLPVYEGRNPGNEASARHGGAVIARGVGRARSSSISPPVPSFRPLKNYIAIENSNAIPFRNAQPLENPFPAR